MKKSTDNVHEISWKRLKQKEVEEIFVNYKRVYNELLNKAKDKIVLLCERYVAIFENIHLKSLCRLERKKSVREREREYKAEN